MRNTIIRNKGSRLMLIFVSLALLFLILPSFVFAGYVGPNIAVSSVAYDQQNPHTIYLPDKNLWFVVWEDWRNFTSTGADIYGQFIKGDDGSFCGSEFVIVGAQGNQTAPWAAYRDKDILSPSSGSDKILVVWQDTKGSANDGYVYRKVINVDAINPADCTGYTLGGKNPVSYHEILFFDFSTTLPLIPVFGENIGTGDGITNTFSGILANSPVVPGSVVFTDGTQVVPEDGHGTCLTSPGVCSIDYESGFVSVAFPVAPPAATPVTVDYSYFTSFPPSTSSVGDSLLSRKSPKVSFDPVRDIFWVVWTESRNQINMVSELCFGFVPVTWEFGDTSFPGYVMIDGNTNTELVNDIGVNGADIIRNAKTRTNRLISASYTAFSEIYTYEFFTNAKNITTSSDITSPEDFTVWEGVRQKGVLTCSCTDNNGNLTCDLADTITSTFTTSNYDDGIVHIYGLFDKEISQNVIFSKKIDSSTSASNYPSVGFDPITNRFLTAWEDLRGGSNTKVFGQIVYSGGGLYNTNFIITDNTDNVLNSKQTKPFVSYDPVNQRFFVVWQDGRNSTFSLENLDIFGQKVDAEGSLRGSNYAVFTLPYNQYNPTIAYNDVNNQFLAVWKDARNADISDILPSPPFEACSASGGVGTGTNPCGSDVYGQRFTLGQPSLTLLKMDDTALTPPLLDEFENPAGSGSVEVGLFDTQSFKVKNTGDTTLLIDYIDDTCNGTLVSIDPFSFDGLPSELFASDGNTLDLVPAAELTLTVRFTPLAGGSYNRCFVIESDGGNPQVNLSALSIESNISVTPTSYAFGSVYIGSFGATTFVVRNVGTAILRITSLVNPVTPFSIHQDGCTGQNLTPGSTCNIVVRFTPTTTVGSPFSSSFGINSNDPDTPTLTVTPLTGTAVGAPDINVTPTIIDFGNVQVNGNSQQVITISNNGTAVLTITPAISSPLAPFSIVGNTCSPDPFALSVGNSCLVTVQYSPTAPGTTSSSFAIQSDDPDEGSVIVNLSGTGVVTPDINVNPAFVNFPSTNVGSSSQQIINVSNIGSANLTITGLTNPAGDFSIVGTDCIGIMAPLGTCTITVSFAPLSGGFKTSSFQINSNDPDTPAFNVTLTGTGAVLPEITVVPSPLAFGSQLIGSTTDMTITVSNEGNANLSISSVSTPALPFSVTANTCLGTPVNPGGSCTITVNFAPISAGVFNSSIDILSNDPDEGTVTVNISGTGSAVAPGPKIKVVPTSHDFGSVPIGTTTLPVAFKVKNTGSSNLTFTSISYPATPYRVTKDTCTGHTIVPGTACTIKIVFNPISVGTFYPYYLIINSNDLSNPTKKVTLSGTGTL